MSTSFVVKLGNDYVAYPQAGYYQGDRRRDEWTPDQRYAWRWTGLESGNGARLAARAIGNGARVIKLVPKHTAQPSSDTSKGKSQ